MGARMRGLVLGAIGLVSWSAPAGAQGFEWPEEPENLEVLTGFSGERLSPVMRGFSRALGVRCVYCHVGEEDAPLSELDFVSDDNDRKRTTRTMLRMLGVINDSLSSIDWGAEARVNMWCHTCHRGRPRPMTLAEELGEIYRRDGVDAALAHYEELRAGFYGRGAYDFGEGSLNEFGYEAMEAEDYAGAQAVFERNLEFYPGSSNAHDSLGEALAARGDTARAIAAYERAVALEPRNRNAARRLAELRGED